jgi:hypothetical protein
MHTYACICIWMHALSELDGRVRVFSGVRAQLAVAADSLVRECMQHTASGA